MSLIARQHICVDIEGHEGLSQCTVCGGAEGEMPMHCPGSQMTDTQKALVLGNSLEFFYNRWWMPVSKPVN